MGAAPHKLTRKTITAIATYRAEGMTLEHASAIAGVHRATLHRWLARAEEGGLFGELARAVVLAEGKLQRGAISVVRAAAASGTWQAAAWLLERTFPDAYSLRASHVVEHRAATRQAAAEMRAQVTARGGEALDRLGAAAGGGAA